MWPQFIILLISIAINIALAPKIPKPKPASLEDFDIPTTEEGTPVPVLFGTCRTTGATLLWYGDLRSAPIKASGK